MMQTSPTAITPTGKAKDGKEKDNAGGDFQKAMNTQMKFLLPVLAFVSIYWIIPAKFPQARRG